MMGDVGAMGGGVGVAYSLSGMVISYTPSSSA